MSSRVNSSKNSTVLEDVKDRTIFLRNLSQGNHVERMKLARRKGENLQANFVIPSSHSRLNSKIIQNGTEKDSQKSETASKDAKRSPYDETKSSETNNKCKFKDVKLHRKHFSPFVIFDVAEQSRKEHCSPDGINTGHKFSTQPKDETKGKLSFKGADKNIKKQLIKEKSPGQSKSNKNKSSKKDIPLGDESNEQLQTINKPHRLKKKTKSSRKMLKPNIQDLTFEQDNRYGKKSPRKDFIPTKTYFDVAKKNIISPSAKRNFNRMDTNLMHKEKFSGDFPQHDTFMQSRQSSGDYVLDESTRIRLATKKNASSETTDFMDRSALKNEPPSFNLSEDEKYKYRKISASPSKSRIPIAMNRIRQFRDNADKMDEIPKYKTIVSRHSVNLNQNTQQRNYVKLDSRRYDDFGTEKIPMSPHKYIKEQKETEMTRKTESFEFSLPSNVRNVTENRERFEPLSSTSVESEHHVTDWTPYLEKFDRDYKKGSHGKANQIDIQVSNDNKTSVEPENDLKSSQDGESSKYDSDFKPNDDFLRSPMEKLIKEIHSAISTFNTDEIFTDDDTPSNSNEEPVLTPKRGQKSKKVKKGKKGGSKKKTSKWSREV